jgi:hypothetical protein
MSVNIYQYGIPADSNLHVGIIFYKNSAALKITITLEGYSAERFGYQVRPLKLRGNDML